MKLLTQRRTAGRRKGEGEMVAEMEWRAFVNGHYVLSFTSRREADNWAANVERKGGYAVEIKRAKKDKPPHGIGVYIDTYADAWD
jgi:hypothetical protein